MNKDFWQKADLRVEENAKLFHEDDWKKKFATPLTFLGLEFWKIGLFLSFVSAFIFFAFFHSVVLSFAKVSLFL